MTYEKLSLIDFLAALQRRVQEYTGQRCYDVVPVNAKSPFYFVEVVKTAPEHTKTMWCDRIIAWIHVIAEPEESSVGIYTLIEQLQEALTRDLDLPEGFTLVLQTDNGLQVLKTDETGEKHAVLAYEFKVCYGFKCKI